MKRVPVCLKLNKLFKNPLELTGNCTVTKLKTGHELIEKLIFKVMWFSQYDATKQNMRHCCGLNRPTLYKEDKNSQSLNN